MNSGQPAPASSGKAALKFSWDVQQSQLGLIWMGIILLLYMIIPGSKDIIETALRVIAYFAAILGKFTLLNLPFIHRQNSGQIILAALLVGVFIPFEIWEMRKQIRRHIESTAHHDYIVKKLAEYGRITLATEAIGSTKNNEYIVAIMKRIYSFEYIAPKILIWVLIQTAVILFLTITSANFIDQVYKTGLGNMAAVFILMNALKYGIGDDGKCEGIFNASGAMIGQTCSSHLYGLPNSPGYGSVVSSESTATILVLVLYMSIFCAWLEGCLLDDGPAESITHVENLTTKKKALTFGDYAKSFFGGLSGAYNCITTVESFVPSNSDWTLKLGILSFTVGVWCFAAWCPIFCLNCIEHKAGGRIQNLAKEMKKRVDRMVELLLLTKYPNGKISLSNKARLSRQQMDLLVKDGQPTKQAYEVFFFMSQATSQPGSMQQTYAALNMIAPFNRDLQHWENDARYDAEKRAKAAELAKQEQEVIQRAKDSIKR